jgi:hypothetical protein
MRLFYLFLTLIFLFAAHFREACGVASVLLGQMRPAFTLAPPHPIDSVHHSEQRLILLCFLTWKASTQNENVMTTSAKVVVVVVPTLNDGS